MMIGIFFLFGGIVASMMIPAAVRFIVLDLVLAYFPMTYLGWLMAVNFIVGRKSTAGMG